MPAGAYKDIIKTSDDSRKIVNHSQNYFGVTIAEMEVAPCDSSLMSLGIFEENNQPRGFSIECTPDPKLPYLIKSEIVIKKYDGRYEYLLKINNNCAYRVSAEIRKM